MWKKNWMHRRVGMHVTCVLGSKHNVRPWSYDAYAGEDERRSSQNSASVSVIVHDLQIYGQDTYIGRTLDRVLMHISRNNSPSSTISICYHVTEITTINSPAQLPLIHHLFRSRMRERCQVIPVWCVKNRKRAGWHSFLVNWHRSDVTVKEVPLLSLNFREFCPYVIHHLHQMMSFTVRC